MSGEYYCEFCNQPMVDSLHMCEKKYDYELAKAQDETMGWSRDIDIEPLIKE